MPESTAPPSTHGVPPQGNGGLIALGVLMLFIAGGLVLWKMNAGTGEPEVVTDTTPLAQPAPAPEVFDNAPPPPPDEEEEKEEKPEEPSKTVGTTKPSGPAGCSGECKGNVTPALQSALASRGQMARSCYMTALRNNPALEGKMTMSVKVSPNGTVCGVSVANNDLGDPSVASCATAKFNAGPFPAPNGGCVTVNVPLNFTAQK